VAAREFSTLGRAFACCSGKHGKVLAMSEVIDTRYRLGASVRRPRAALKFVRRTFKRFGCCPSACRQR